MLLRGRAGANTKSNRKKAEMQLGILSCTKVLEWHMTISNFNASCEAALDDSLPLNFVDLYSLFCKVEDSYSMHRSDVPEKCVMAYVFVGSWTKNTSKIASLKRFGLKSGFTSGRKIDYIFLSFSSQPLSSFHYNSIPTQLQLGRTWNVRL